MKTAPGKGSFLQTALLFITIFLGLQLLMSSFNAKPDARTSAQIYAEMQKHSAALRDQSIAHEYQAYVKKLGDEAKLNPISDKEMEAKRLAASTLVADTQFKSGVQRKSTNKLTMAMMTLVGYQKSLQDDPVWKQSVKLSPPENEKTKAQFPALEASPEKVYANIVAELKKFNESDLVWGITNGHRFIDALVALTGSVPGFSYWFAALLLAVVVRAIVWPLTQKQLMWSRQMMQLQPLIKELKDKYQAPELNVKMMELYKEYGINPASGCLPMFIQLPLFFFVYQCMLQYRFDFLNGTFLWINPVLGKETHGFTARSLGDMDIPLLIIYGISMVVTTFLAPVSDPTQLKQQRTIGIMMAVMFTVGMFFYPLPSAFVLYWIFTNILSTIQSLRAYRLPVPPLKKINAPNGAVYPNGGITNGSTNGSMFRNTGTPKVQKPKKKR